MTGVLDWDMLRVVDPALDVIKAENQFRREGNPAQAFRQGYESQRNIGINQETEQVYRLLSEVGKLSALQNLKEATNTQMDENELIQTLNNIDQLLSTG